MRLCSTQVEDHESLCRCKSGIHLSVLDWHCLYVIHKNLLLSYGNGCDQRSFRRSGTASASGFVAAVVRCLPFHLNRNRYVAGSSPPVAYLMGTVRSDPPVVPTLPLFRQTLSLSFHIFLLFRFGRYRITAPF